MEDFTAFTDFLKRRLDQMEAETKNIKDGDDDTVQLSRKQFRRVFGTMGGVEASNTNKEHSETMIGRLCILESLMGRERYTSFMSTLGMLIEEYVFGPVNGERSSYRIDE